MVEHEWGEMSQINFCEIYLDKLYTALGLSAGAFTTNNPAKAWYLKPSLVQLYQSKKTRSLIVILFVLRSMFVGWKITTVVKQRFSTSQTIAVLK